MWEFPASRSNIPREPLLIPNTLPTGPTHHTEAQEEDADYNAARCPRSSVQRTLEAQDLSRELHSGDLEPYYITVPYFRKLPYSSRNQGPCLGPQNSTAGPMKRTHPKPSFL